MNLFEAGILPSIPLGAIIGGVLCKSFGILATIGGIVGGGIAGFFLGWLYGFLIILLMAAFTISWKLIRRLPDPMGMTDKEQDYFTRSSTLGIIAGITIAGIIGLTSSWGHGLIAVFIAAVVTAFVAVVGTQIHFRNKA